MVHARAIVAATGGAPSLELVRAHQIAEARDARVHVVAVGAGESVVDHGPAVVSEVAEGARAELVVVGERRAGKRPFAERVHETARRAVLQVRGPVREPYRHIVVAVDVTSNLRAMTSMARFVAPEAESLEYLHAYESPFEPTLLARRVDPLTIRRLRRECREDAEARAREVLVRADRDPSKLRLVFGRPAEVLGRVPRGVLVVVNRGRSPSHHALYGSVTREVLARGEADVLVV